MFRVFKHKLRYTYCNEMVVHDGKAVFAMKIGNPRVRNINRCEQCALNNNCHNECFGTERRNYWHVIFIDTKIKTPPIKVAKNFLFEFEKF